jgi:hypothetical protein
MIFIMFFTVLIHLESFGLFSTQCVLFLLSTFEFLIQFEFISHDNDHGSNFTVMWQDDRGKSKAFRTGK